MISKSFFFNKALSYNQPKFCSTPTWDPNATTFANSSTVGSAPYATFVSSNNEVYVTDYTNARIQIWLNNSINPTRTITGNLSMPCSVFATSDGNIYIDNNNDTRRVDQRRLDTNTSVTVIYTNSSCQGLFVDINDTLYCSMFNSHQVVKKWLGDNTTTWTIVAGVGGLGSASDMLNIPRGIFVDTNFDLYVADSDNNRIQLFQLEQLNGTTVAGSASLNVTITLSGPSGIVLDADKYFYIVDRQNNRIVGSGPTGFRCLVGCSGSGSSAYQLDSPWSLSFDTFGNMFVTDMSNARIQKFIVSTNSCGKAQNMSLKRLICEYSLK